MERSPLRNEVAGVFEEYLPRLMGEGYERRGGQLDMADQVAAAFDEGRVAVIEAETGLGKSLAYLIPLALYCKRSGGRAVVSTHTRNLQRQLMEKDFPLASGAAGDAVTGAVLLGRTNYACRRGVEAFLEKGVSDPALAAWLGNILDDDIGDLGSLKDSSVFLNPTIRSAISCPWKETVCSGCRQRNQCFLFTARRRALDSQVVMVNHALLFANLATDGALLGPHDILVIDEAHHLEDVATQCLTMSFSPRTIRGSQQSVYSPQFEETVAYARAMVANESIAAGNEVDTLWASYHESMRTADKKTGELFAALDENVESLALRPGNRNAGERVQLVYEEGAPLFYGVETLVSEIATAIGQMTSAVGRILKLIEGHDALVESGIIGAIKAIGDVAAETLVEFEFLTAGSADDHVFYACSTNHGHLSELAASPVDVSARLGVMLEEGAAATVLTSATLAVDGDFSYTLNRVGLDRSGRVATRSHESPFDLESQRVVLIASYLPDPGSTDFLEEASGTVGDAVRALGKRTLMLCTAKSQIPPLVRLLSSDADLEDALFVQTQGGSRGDLLERFKNKRRGVLVGLASFWEGVDLPGDLLEFLVVLKLPFLVPSDPVVRARAKHITDSGEDPFEKMFIPDVVLKLRQGIGRLIRTSSDRGVVLLLDRRLWHSHYGEFVSRAATRWFVQCNDKNDLLEQIEKYKSGVRRGRPNETKRGERR